MLQKQYCPPHHHLIQAEWKRCPRADAIIMYLPGDGYLYLLTEPFRMLSPGRCLIHFPAVADTKYGNFLTGYFVHDPVIPYPDFPIALQGFPQRQTIRIRRSHYPFFNSFSDTHSDIRIYLGQIPFFYIQVVFNPIHLHGTGLFRNQRFVLSGLQFSIVQCLP